MLLVHGPLDSGRTYTSGSPGSQAPGFGLDLQGLSLHSRGTSQARDHMRQALRAHLSLYLHLPRGSASLESPGPQIMCSSVLFSGRLAWTLSLPSSLFFYGTCQPCSLTISWVLGRALLTMRPGGQDAPDMMGALKPLLDT